MGQVVCRFVIPERFVLVSDVCSLLLRLPVQVIVSLEALIQVTRHGGFGVVVVHVSIDRLAGSHGLRGTAHASATGANTMRAAMAFTSSSVLATRNGGTPGAGATVAVLRQMVSRSCPSSATRPAA